jgi:aminoglycoside 3-N-acetyltransferase
MSIGLTAHDFRSAIQALNISGKVVCLHTSLRSFGRIDAPSPQMAAQRIIESFLAEGCTVLVPTFSRIYEVLPPSSAMFIPHNAIDIRNINRLWYDYLVAVRYEYKTPYFTPQSDMLDAKDMGLLPTTLLKMTGRVRGNHPLMSFTAIGDKAESLVATQTPQDGYAPMRELIAQNGLVGLLGVGYERMSLLHLAEKVAGRRLFTRWASNENGDVINAEVGGCSNGFGKFASVLNALSKVAIVGKSLWRFYDAQAVLERASALIRKTPTITQCDNPTCAFCRDVLSQNLTSE